MGRTITVMPNQSMDDVVLQATGSMEAAMRFCYDNGVAVSDVPAVNTVYVVSDEALALGNKGVLQYLKRNRITIGTLAANLPIYVLATEAGGEALVTEEGEMIEVE